ncbi:GNAT family N-acetyltransferase [Taibaiella lutea]|uniref:GNAT family N-acetyltransferase n=1 Tax=Taibaiella lutea TaxID=2608001 RepID=A0A5M6CIJ4_9BACT|nr:GNAT family N-acetyltransferase [Taibaiella lutea]KAA5535028.1 GNAT family N-acetyltransferase [Taibaiella lutea]
MTHQNDIIFPDYRYEGYLFSTNKEKVQPEVVHQFLDKESYWAKGVPYETVKRAIQYSLSIGIYDENGNQVGFGRMITDRATFAYLADIFVIKAHRGKGLSKEMMKGFCKMADEFQLRRFLLTTQDAHDLYRQSGFEMFPWLERLMSRPGVVYKQ